MKKLEEVKTRNLVAKHARTYNKAHKHANRKQLSKRGHVKHKGRGFDAVA